MLARTFAGVTFLAAGISFAFGYLTRFRVSSMRQRVRNLVIMRCPGNPDQLSLTLGGPVVLSVYGFVGGGGGAGEILSWRGAICLRIFQSKGRNIGKLIGGVGKKKLMEKGGELKKIRVQKK